MQISEFYKLNIEEKLKITELELFSDIVDKDKCFPDPCLLPDISGCPSLRKLTLNGDWLKPSASEWVTFGQKLALLPALTSLTILLDLSHSKGGIIINDTEKWNALCGAIAECSVLMNFYLYSPFSAQRSSWQTLSNALAQCSYLTSFSLGDRNHIPNFFANRKDYHTFFQALAQGPALTSLTSTIDAVNSNHYSRLNLQAISQEIPQLQALTTLTLYVNYSSNTHTLLPWKEHCEGWEELCRALPQLQSLTTLQLSNHCVDLSKFPSEAWQSLGQSLAQCNNLTSLDLSSNNLRNMSASQWNAFCQMIASCPSLTSLSLNGCDLAPAYGGPSQVSAAQWQTLGQAFSRCHYLVSLDLSHNYLYGLRTHEWFYFGQTIAQCPNLTLLNLGDNNLASLSSNPPDFFSWSSLTQWEAFCNAIAQSKTLQDVRCRDWMEGRLSTYPILTESRKQKIKAILDKNNTKKPPSPPVLQSSTIENVQQQNLAAEQKRQRELAVERRTQDILLARKQKEEALANEARKKQELAAALRNKDLITDYCKSLLKEVEKFDAKARDIKTLLDKGADINYQDEKNGYTALMIAVDAQSDRIAEYLLNQSANPLLLNKAGEKASDLASSDSPIHQRLKGFELIAAALTGDLTAVRLAINTNASINFKGIGGYTPLLIAVENKHVDVVRFLLSRGADITITRNDGQGPLELVTDETILELLDNASSTNAFENEYSQADSSAQKCPSGPVPAVNDRKQPPSQSAKAEFLSDFSLFSQQTTLNSVSNSTKKSSSVYYESEERWSDTDSKEDILDGKGSECKQS